MTLEVVDYYIVVLFVFVCLVVGIAARRQAGRSLEEYFLGGRKLGWFVAGSSMAATMLAIDTPLVVSGMVGQEGIAGNWFWWHGVVGCAMIAFLFAPLWRRMGILTDNEIIEIRYSGPSAEILRGVRGFIDGFIRPAVVISLISLVMGEVASVMLGISPGVGIFIFVALTGLYTIVSGFRGVVATDLLQLFVALVGTVVFAIYVASGSDGDLSLAERVAEAARNTVEGLPAFLGETSTERANDIRSFIPLESVLTPFSSILIFLSIAWWVRGNADGGNYLAQRAFATRDRRHSRLAYVWFGVVNFCLRPWPWIVVGLVGFINHPAKWLAGSRLDVEFGYIEVVGTLLPAGLRGLLVVSLLAAFMSTVDTQLNCGAAYLVNDLWKRFLARGQPQQHYVRMARMATLILLVVSLLVTVILSEVLWASIKRVWEFLLLVGAGIGGVMIFRWYWWRINAWSELAAIVAAPVFALLLTLAETQLGPVAALAFPYSLLWVSFLTTGVWVATTLLTPAVPEVNLLRFYMRCRPGGPGWRRMAFRIPGFEDDGPGRRGLVSIPATVGILYAGMFGIGHLVLGNPSWGWTLVLAAIVGWGILWWNWKGS